MKTILIALALFICSLLPIVAFAQDSVATNTTAAPTPPPPPTEKATVVGVKGTLEQLEQNTRIPTSFVAATIVMAVLIIILWIDKFFPPTTVEDLPGRDRRLAMLKPPRAWTIPPVDDPAALFSPQNRTPSQVASPSMGAGDDYVAPLLDRTSPRADNMNQQQLFYRDDRRQPQQQQQQTPNSGRRSAGGGQRYAKPEL